MAALALLIALAICVGLVYRAATQVPEFYLQALEHDPVEAKEAGDELERRALELRNDAQQGGQWEAVFTAEQVNGWLAVDLVNKFPNLLPPEVQSPRVAMSPSDVQLAFRFQNAQVNTVVSLSLGVSLTEEPNVVAIRVRKARAGSLPVPLAQFLDQIAQAAHEADIDLRWSRVEGDPVALVRLPIEHTELPDRTLHLEAIELKPNQVRLAGKTTWKNGKP